MIGGSHPVWNGVLLPLTPCERVTYLYLTARRNEDGYAWPKAPTIARAVGYSLREVERSLSRLHQTRGLIEHCGLIDPTDPYSAVRWLVPTPTSVPEEAVPTPTTAPIPTPTSPGTDAHVGHKKQGSNSSKKHTPLPPNGEEDARVEVTIRDGFQLDRRGCTVGVATSEMEASTSSSQVNAAEVQHVFDAWIASTGRTGRTRLDAKRRKAIQRALSDYPLPDVLDAVRGWVRDPWPDRVLHNDVTVLLRDAEHIEKFRRLQQEGPPPVRVKPKGAQALANAFPDVPDDLGAMVGWGNGLKSEPSVIKTNAIEGPR